MKKLVIKILDNHELSVDEIDIETVDENDAQIRIVQNDKGGWKVEIDQPEMRTAHIEEFVNCVAFPEDVKARDRREPAEFYAYLNAFLNQYNPAYFYSPKTQLFFDAIKKTIPDGIQHIFMPAEYDGLNPDLFVFSDLVEKIREMRRSVEFVKQHKKWRENFRKSYKSKAKYVEALFEKYAKLLVVRLDLGFKKSLVEKDFSIETAKLFFTKFLNAKRSNKIFRDVVGYVWKLEYGKSKGYHYHLLIFLHGSDARNDAYRGFRMGQYWLEVTNKKGAFYLGNLNKRYFQKHGLLGIGMISHFDKGKRENLDRILRYFFKEDQYIKEKPKRGTRICGSGEIPSLKKSGLGRPRSSTRN